MDFYGTIGPACADVKLLQQMVDCLLYTSKSRVLSGVMMRSPTS